MKYRGLGVVVGVRKGAVGLGEGLVGLKGGGGLFDPPPNPIPQNPV